MSFFHYYVEKAFLGDCLDGVLNGLLHLPSGELDALDLLFLAQWWRAFNVDRQRKPAIDPPGQ